MGQADKSETLTTLCFHCFLGVLMSSDIERNGLTHCNQLSYSYISVVYFFFNVITMAFSNLKNQE